MKRKSIMSRQLAVASAFSVFALSAFALLGPSATPMGGTYATGAAMDIAAPAFAPDFTVELQLID